MTTKLLEALDSATGWNLTPPQRQAILDAESKILALQMGYQLHEKALKRQAQTIDQLLGKIHQLEKHQQKNQGAIKRQRAMICQLLAKFNDLKQEVGVFIGGNSSHFDGLRAEIDSIAARVGFAISSIHEIKDTLKSPATPKRTTRKSTKKTA